MFECVSLPVKSCRNGVRSEADSGEDSGVASLLSEVLGPGVSDPCEKFHEDVTLEDSDGEGDPFVDVAGVVWELADESPGERE